MDRLCVIQCLCSVAGKKNGIVQQTLATEEVIFLAGLVFISSQIFKRGVEIC